MKKRALAMILATVLCLALAVPALAAGTTFEEAMKLPFTDVAEDHWAYADIQYCYHNKLFAGKSETSFDPNGKLTVAEAVALAGRLCYMTHGGTGALPAVPDLTGVYARFYDENGKELAAFDQEHILAGGNGSYIALSAEADDKTLPETCTMEVGLEGFCPIKTSKGTRQTYASSGGHMSWGLKGTGYVFEDQEAAAQFWTLYNLNHPDIDTAASVKEWWYPADFYLRYYNNYSAITDMCFHISLAHPDENGAYSTDYDPVGDFPKERATRTMFACLINGAVSEELAAINDTSAVPDVVPGETHDAEEILRLYGAGIITGVDDTGRFNGAGELTRAEAAAILARVLKPELRVKN